MNSMTMFEFAVWWTCMLTTAGCVAALYLLHRAGKEIALDLEVFYRLDNDGDLVLDNGTIPLKLLQAADANHMEIPKYPYGVLSIECSSHHVNYFKHPRKRAVDVYIGDGTGWTMSFTPFQTAGNYLITVPKTLARLMRLDNSKRVNYRVLVFRPRTLTDERVISKASENVLKLLSKTEAE